MAVEPRVGGLVGDVLTVTEFDHAHHTLSLLMLRHRRSFMFIFTITRVISIYLIQMLCTILV
jgi:hypothetical protein